MTNIPQAPSQLAPAKPDRIHMVDALRGFALLGLFLVHCVERFELYWLDPKPDAVFNTVFFFFAGKAYAIFALLFGLSFFIIMDRQAQKGVDFTGRFIWRLTVLLGIGFLHTLLYLGDILEVLALIGLVLVVAWRWSNKWLLIVAAICALQPVMLFHLWAALTQQPFGNGNPLHWAMFVPAYGNLVHADFWQTLASNAWTGNSAKLMFFVESWRGILLISLFMVGLVLGRLGFFNQPEKFARGRRQVFILALLGSIIFFSLQKYVTSLPDANFVGLSKYYLDNLLDAYASTSIMTLWVVIFIWLYQLPSISQWLRLLAPCGRMSLSIYLAQAIICIPLFYPFGLSWYNSISSAHALLFGFAVYGCLMVIAHWWIKHFYYGPAEWVWRAATYTTLKVPFKRKLD